MANAVITGVFTKDSSGTEPVDQTVSWSSPDFTPKFVMLWTDGQTSESSSTTHGCTYSIGVTDGTNEASCMVSNEDGVSTSNTSSQISNTKLLKIRDDTGTLIAECDFKEFGNKQFTITWTENTNTAATRIYYWAIGGSDITNIEVGSFDANTSTGSQEVNISGTFQPDSLITLTTGQTAFDTENDHARLNMGFGVSSTKRRTHSMRSEHNASISDEDRSQENNEIISLINTTSGNSIDGEADLTSLDSDGFTINWGNAPPAAWKIIYVAIKGGLWDVVEWAQDGSNGDKTISTSLTSPNGLICTSVQTGTIGSSIDGTFHLGAADSEINNSNTGFYSDGGAINVDISTINSATRCVDFHYYTGSTRGQGAITAWGTSDFTMNWTNNSGSGRLVYFLICDVQDSGSPSPTFIPKVVIY